MLRPFAHPVACWMLLRKVWNRSNFPSNNSQHFFCSMIAVVLRNNFGSGPFAQLFQHCWGHSRALHMVYNVLWVVSFPWCTAGSNVVGSCCIFSHTTANTHSITPNNVGSCCIRLHVAWKEASHGIKYYAPYLNSRFQSSCRAQHINRSLALICFYYIDKRVFPFTKKSYLHRAQWRYYFYLSRVRILVLPWLLTWLGNYKRPSRSGARPVLLKFHFVIEFCSSSLEFWLFGTENVSIIVFISPL